MAAASEAEATASVAAEARAAAEAAARAQLMGDEADGDGDAASGRAAKVKQRDAAVKRILRREARSLHLAMGVSPSVPPKKLQSKVRSMLRLLHPDYAINSEIKGTPHYARIEAAFKKLNGLKATEA